MAKKTKKAARPQVDGETQVAIASEQTITLGELSERYLKHLEERGAGPGTVLSYGMELKTAAKQLGSEAPIGLLTVDRVAEYFASDAVRKTRAGKSKAPPTYLKTQRVLRLALVFAEQHGWLAKAPLPESKTEPTPEAVA